MPGSKSDVQLSPMDVFSEMRVPFDIGAYCRGHKLCIQSVNLARAIEKRKRAEQSLALAEEFLAGAEDNVATAIEAVREKMKKDPV